MVIPNLGDVEGCCFGGRLTRHNQHLGVIDRGKQMLRKKSEDSVDITGRLRMIQQLEVPGMVAPRRAADAEMEKLPPLLDIDPHVGRMYVAGREPHFRPVTLLKPRSSRHDDPDPT